MCAYDRCHRPGSGRGVHNGGQRVVGINRSDNYDDGTAATATNSSIDPSFGVAFPWS